MSDTFIPNSFQCPNAYVDRVMAYLTGSETKVLLFAIREIYGWRDSVASRRACIALSVFSEGKRNKAGEQLCNGCGLGVGTIRNAIKELCRFGIMVKMGGPGPSGQEYFLQDNADLLNWTAMEERRAESEKANAEQMSEAIKKHGVWLNDRGMVEHKGVGIVEPHAGGIVEPQEGNTIETQLRNPYIDAGQKTPAPPKAKAPKADIPPAVEIYREVFLSYPRKNTWGDIAAVVIPHNGNMGLWREIVTTWKLLGNNPMNIKGMLDCWRKGEVPKVGYTQKQTSRARQPLTQQEAQALYDAMQREKASNETP